jgi:hypothetical protein
MKKIKGVFLILLLTASFFAGSYLTITKPTLWVNFWKLKKFDCINPYKVIKTELKIDFKNQQTIIYPVIESPDNWTALDQLVNTVSNKINGKGVSAFITEINSYSTEGKKEFWAFYVNGKQSTVGAGSYQLKDGDKIEWKIEKY